MALSILASDWWIPPLARDPDVIWDRLPQQQLLLQISFYPSALTPPSSPSNSHDNKSLSTFSTNFFNSSLTHIIMSGRKYPLHLMIPTNLHWLHLPHNVFYETRLERSLTRLSFQVARVARVSARVAPSVTARSCATTSRVSPSPLSAVSLAVVVSSVSPP
jgi:hypothetical protein